MNTPQTDLTVIERLEFPFLGETISAYYLSNNRVAVAVAHLSQLVGTRTDNQTEQILNDEVYEGYLYQMDVPTLYQNTVRNRNMLLMDSKRVPYWLGRLDRNRIARENEEKRQRILQIQASFADTLDAVHRSILVPPDVQAEIDTRDNLSPQQQALYAEGERLALIIEAIHTLQETSDATHVRMDGLEGRLTELHQTLIRTLYQFQSHITIDGTQAGHLHKIVEEMGKQLLARDRKLDSHKLYNGLWREFNNSFGINRYEMLPQESFSQAHVVLRNMWRQHLRQEPPAGLFEYGIQSDLFSNESNDFGA